MCNEIMLELEKKVEANLIRDAPYQSPNLTR
jgi:hypothetical protein